MKDAEPNGHPSVSIGRGMEYPGVLFPIRKPRGWCETRGFTVFAILTVHSAHAKDLRAWQPAPMGLRVRRWKFVA